MSEVENILRKLKLDKEKLSAVADMLKDLKYEGTAWSIRIIVLHIDYAVNLIEKKFKDDSQSDSSYRYVTVKNESGFEYRVLYDKSRHLIFTGSITEEAAKSLGIEILEEDDG